MKKHLNSLILLIVCILLISGLLVNFSLAEEYDVAIKNYFAQGSGNELNPKIVFGTLYSALNIVGYAVAVIMIIYVGIMYMVASPSKKAEAKGRLINVLVGAGILGSVITILNIVQILVKSVK